MLLNSDYYGNIDMASMKKEPIEKNSLLADTINYMVGIYTSKSDEPRKSCRKYFIHRKINSLHKQIEPGNA